MLQRPDLSIVVLADGRENLEMLLPALRETIARMGIAVEILVAGGDPNDGTVEYAIAAGAGLVKAAHSGYGGALLAGLKAARAPYIATMDADLSHRPVVIEELWRGRAEAEVAIASRYVAGGRAEMGPLRRLFSRILNRTFGRVLSLPLKDLSSGFRLYRREAVDGVELQSRDFDVLEEILIRVYCEGWRIREVPFRYMARRSRGGGARPIRLAWVYLKTLLRMWRLRNSVDSADYDYRAFDSVIWLQRYWQRKRHEIVLNFVRGQDSILDIGCGSSRIVLDLPNAVGLDILQRKLRWLRPKHPKVVRASGDSLPFPDGSFDAVINSEVIEHVPKDPAVLAEMRRVLRPGGTLVLGTPDYSRRLWLILEWIYGTILPGAYAHEHITHYTYRGLKKQLEGNGFEVLDCQYVGYCEMIFRARRI